MQPPRWRQIEERAMPIRTRQFERFHNGRLNSQFVEILGYVLLLLIGGYTLAGWTGSVIAAVFVLVVSMVFGFLFVLFWSSGLFER
jgi:hypothetical protein